MTTNPIPRLRDPIALAKLIGDIATVQVEDGRDDGKDAAAFSMGKNGGAAEGLGERDQAKPTKIEAA